MFYRNSVGYARGCVKHLLQKLRSHDRERRRYGLQREIRLLPAAGFERVFATAGKVAECFSGVRSLTVNDSAADDLSRRVVALEMALAHLQHDFEQVHHVALDLQRELRQVTLRLLRLEQRLETLSEDPEVRSPEGERPPHY